MGIFAINIDLVYEIFNSFSVYRTTLSYWLNYKPFTSKLTPCLPSRNVSIKMNDLYNKKVVKIYRANSSLKTQLP